MKAFVTSILFVAVAVALTTALPQLVKPTATAAVVAPEPHAANPAADTPASGVESASTGTKQNPITDTFNAFGEFINNIPQAISNIPATIGMIPQQISNTFSNPNAGATAAAPAMPNFIENIGQGFNNFVNGIFNPQPTKVSDKPADAGAVAPASAAAVTEGASR